jgi:hypothetical protein
MSTQCAKCGSERVVPKATIWDQGRGSWGGLQVYVYGNPDAFIFKDTTYATLYARVCGDCGFAELYAHGAAELYDAYRQGRAQNEEKPVEKKRPERLTEEPCLSCGRPIPPAVTACPACGWTWNTG